MDQHTRHLYTIPADVPFLERLAEGILERSGGLTPELARMLVLLPTRRACRSLRDTFLRLSDGVPVLLPRLQPLGDVDQDELDLRLAGLYGVEGLVSVPPAIESPKRLFLLMGLIEKWNNDLSPDQSLQLAKSLAVLLDQVHTEDLDYTKLAQLVPESLSEHWQLTLKFLTIITEAWPLILAQEQQIDPADRRNRLRKLMAQSWQDNPPDTPVIAAGSTGSIPSTAALLDVVSRMKQGAVILPGLDLELDETSWQTLEDTHPQATMRALLRRFDAARTDVRLWGSKPAPAMPRRLLGRALMQPADTVQIWTEYDEAHKKELQQSLDGITLIEADTPAEEALAIAVLMRETLETPGATASLVTPDRTLARRVCSALRQWNVLVDDSAGTSLPATHAGELATMALACVLEEFTPLSVLNLLRHPYNKIGNDPALIARFDKLLCRGARPRPGLAGLQERADLLAPAAPEINSLLEQLGEAFAPLTGLRGRQAAPEFAKALATVCETFAGSRDFLWGQDDGDALSAILRDFINHAEILPPMDMAAYAGLLSQMMAQCSVRPSYGGHSRLTILGQLEARMLSADLMILGSLNENSWPAEPQHDPWMSRPMRKEFGLPSPDRSIGLSAHDFVQALCHKRVALTRSLKAGGVQTVPSRWLQRFSTLRVAAGLQIDNDPACLTWARHLYKPGTDPLAATCPQPRPATADRPVQLSATWIEKWLKNPYQIYAAKILRLRLLDLIDQESDASDRGSFIHDILHEFIEQTRERLPANPQDLLYKIAERKIAEQGLDSAAWQYWKPRLERALAWVAQQEKLWREDAMPYLAEATGTHDFRLADGSIFTLTAKADRIDRLKSGGVAIIDYKTGTPPPKSQMLSGQACQLPLEGVLMHKGGYGEILPVKLLSHWKISGGSEAGRVQDTDPYKDGNMIEAAEQGLVTLASQYRQPDMPYTATVPSGARLYDDEKAIAHLARTAEWSSIDSEDSDGGDA